MGRFGLGSWWGVFAVEVEQYLTGHKQSRGSRYLDIFLAKKSKSELQSQRGSKRSRSIVGGKIPSKEIKTWREISRREVESQRESKRRSGDGNEQTEGSRQVGWGFQLCHLEG